MNPSVYIDSDGDILVNLRQVNYTLYISENEKRFFSPWGPLTYLHPEKDQRLVTNNFLCRLDKDYNVINYTTVEMLERTLLSGSLLVWKMHGLFSGMATTT